MRIYTDTTYVLENGELAHIKLFFSGDETIPAHYQGAIEGNCLANWRPDGVHMNSVDGWALFRKVEETGRRMIVNTQVGTESDMA